MQTGWSVQYSTAPDWLYWACRAVESLPDQHLVTTVIAVIEGLQDLDKCRLVLK